jgi:hypothetical protein
VREGLRQAARRPRVADLICSTEDAIYLYSRERHYARLAGLLFGQQVAATRIQAVWRGLLARRWYRHFKKTAEFAQRQQAYEAQLRVRPLDTPASPVDTQNNCTHGPPFTAPATPPRVHLARLTPRARPGAPGRRHVQGEKHLPGRQHVQGERA